MGGNACVILAKKVIEEKNRRFAKAYVKKALSKGDKPEQIITDLMDLCEILPTNAKALYESCSAEEHL